MLINQLGTEDEGDDVARLADRRPVSDPRNRETLTMLLASSLNPVPRSELMSPAPASVTALDAAAADRADEVHGAASDVA